MKTLILTCNTGQGHNSVSAAIKEEFDKNSSECVIYDALSFLSRHKSKLICNWHVRIYRYMPKLFSDGYRHAEENPSVFDEKSLAYRIIASASDRLYDYVRENDFDVIICTHVISGLLVTDSMNKHPDFRALTSFTATDYTASPMTDESRLDYYFVSDESVVDEFVSCGISRDKLVVVDGIPVRHSFIRKVPEAKAKTLLGIPSDMDHILLMCGSMGCGPIDELTKKLHELNDNCCITVCCGTNRILYRKLNRIYRAVDNVRILGYYRNVSILMDSADLFITKPGGISTSEAAVKKLPMVFVNVVAGCENHNLEYFLRKGSATTTDNVEDIPQLVFSLLSDKNKLKTMGDSGECKGLAAQQIYNHLRRQYEE